MCIIDQEESYHMRVTIDRKDAPSFIDEYIKKFGPVIYIFSYEEVEQNHHIHAHLVFPVGKEQPKQTRSDWFKKMGFAKKYYFEKTKESINNILYVLKDLDILKHNVCEKHYDKVLQQTKVINADKKKQAREKLLELFMSHLREEFKGQTEENYEEYKKKREYWQQFSSVALFIHKAYVRRWNKSPPISQMKGMVLYICEKADESQQCPVYYGSNIEQFYLGLF